jgi:branched-chain amino acid transport system permease protein
MRSGRLGWIGWPSKRTEPWSAEKVPAMTLKQVFYGLCLLVVVMFLPDGVWPPLARALGFERKAKR